MTPDANATQQGSTSPSSDQRHVSVAHSTPGDREEGENVNATGDGGEGGTPVEQGEGSVGGGGTSGGESSKKRKIPPTEERRSSARGVANLTPEQLAKKRANDREAQRSIRQRTKNQMEGYERRIRELTSQQPYQELQQVIRQKEMVEQENLDIKKRLSQVIALITPILGAHGFEIPQLPPQPNYSPPNRPNSANRNASTPNSIASPNTVAGPSWPASSASMPVAPTQDSRSFIQSQQTQQLAQQRHEMAHNLELGPERLGLDFLLDEGQRGKIPIPPPGPLETTGFQQMQRPADSMSPIHQRNNSTASSTTNYNTPNNSSGSGSGSETNGFSAPIRNGPPTCPLDSLLLDFLQERQAAALEGLPTPKLVGPVYPSVSSLLNPSRGITSHPVSKVFTDILATFPDLSTLPERVAVLYIMFLLMRWQIHPSQANYDRLPSWITPRPSQLFTPHPAWIDHLPWPKMRDILVRDYNPRDYLFDNFFIPFTGTLSVNWPYEPTDALLNSGGGSGGSGLGLSEEGELLINPVFERHLRRLENWSLGPQFASAFPGLRDTYRVKMEGDRR
ncbi:hypothetical protein BELL_0208g00160 [Botrytis elliptica]|uniref:BZIP domain-containing protein n=1 Tax=Botrytis elliptica TaxID=278938 RepID=A0A4Z1JPY6_9HELO|nr:hypothetical protein EAE99_003378 [Botrytis elliptica]TGO75536.1 hypothetical protein BELL_0208g00160 [Botrytis elliptica]